MEKKKVLLIAMPWNNIYIPSAALATLGAYLRSQGIEVDIKHYYLKLANKIGISLYQYLQNMRFDGSILYSHILFPDKEKGYMEYLQDQKENEHFSKKVNIPEVVEKIRAFHQEVLADIQFEKYDLIGFSLNYQQTIPSLALARDIKEIAPDQTIVFGGSSCSFQMGESLLRTFPYVDFVVSGQGEQALYEIIQRLRNNEPLDQIPGVYSRNCSQLVANSHQPLTRDFKEYPYADFTDFYAQYPDYLKDHPQFDIEGVSLPIEASRGCWWHRCAFCGINIQFTNAANSLNYCPRNPKRVAAEIDYQMQRHQKNNFFFTNNIQHQITTLTTELLRYPADRHMLMEGRANLTAQDIYRLKEAGFTQVQVGIESLSTSILNKMQKGTTAIENINVIKWFTFLDLNLEYNIISYFPTEEPREVEEQIQNAQKITHLRLPTTLNPYKLAYLSPVFNQPEKYNIAEMWPEKGYTYMFPSPYLEKLCLFYYDYKARVPLQTKELWAQFEELLKSRRKSPAYLKYIDGHHYLKILDSRNSDTLTTAVLPEHERAIYLYCMFIRSREDIYCHFASLKQNFIDETLATLVQYNLVFQEGDLFLSLALPESQYSINRLMNEIRHGITEQ